MRRVARVLGAAVVVALARAASAVVLPVEAELTIQFGTGPHASRSTATASGTAVANGAGPGGPLQSLSLPAGLFSPSGLLADVTDPAAAPIEGLLATYANGAGSFAVGGGTLGGAMPLLGVLKVCLFANCPAAPGNIIVPLAPIGAGGAATQAGVVSLTIQGAPWTTGTVMAGNVATTETHAGSRHGPASAPGSTAAAGGSIQLVTPFVFSTSIAADGPASGFAFLTLHFVPEPATVALLGAGVALLAAVGRRRG